MRFYTDTSRGVEAFTYDGSDPVTIGKEALIEKAKKWDKKFETLQMTVSEPSVMNENQFILEMSIETQDREPGEVRFNAEYILYTIENDKVVEERFFYKKD